MTPIKLEPGALDGVPYVELARFLAGYSRELVYRPDGLYIRRMSTAPAYCRECGEHEAGCVCRRAES